MSGNSGQPGGRQARRPAAACVDAVGGSARVTSKIGVFIGAPPGIRLPEGEGLSSDLPPGGYTIRLAGRRRNQAPFLPKGDPSSDSLSFIRSRLLCLHGGLTNCHVRQQLFLSIHAAASGLKEKPSATSIPFLARRVKLHGSVALPRVRTLSHSGAVYLRRLSLRACW